MLRIPATTVNRSLSGLSRRQLSTTRSLLNKESSQKTEPKPMNPHAAFYRDFAGPMAKILAITFSTYYGMRYAWEYLESLETENETKSE